MKSEKAAKELASRILREYHELVYIGVPLKGAFYRSVETIEMEQKIQNWLGEDATPGRIRRSINLLRKACRLESVDTNRMIIWRKIRQKLDELSKDF